MLNKISVQNRDKKTFKTVTTFLAFYVTKQLFKADTFSILNNEMPLE